MRVHHVRQGSGPPLVLIPGTACDWRVWRPVLAPLAAQRDVIAVDLPGFGASPPLAHRPDPAALAGAVVGLLDELGIERAHVAGSSLGAAVAIEVGRLRRARSVCALAPIGLWTARESTWVQALVRVSVAADHAPEPMRRALTGSAALRTLGLSHVLGRPWAVEAQDAFALTEVASPGLDAILAAYRDYRLPAEDPPDCPVTVAWGTRDRLLLRRQARRLAGVLPGATLVELEGLGHLPMLDDPPRVAALLLDASATA